MTETTTTFWSAPELAKAGYPVFPISEGTKRPSVSGGFYAATTDVSEIAKWIEDGHGDDNIGIATGIVSGVVVVEADDPKSYAEMEVEYGPPAVKTRRGGHWYFAHPRDGKVVSNNIKPGLDRKGDGGYVVVPPSDGRSWTSGIPDKAALPPLPDALRGEKKASSGTVSDNRESKLDAEVRRRAAVAIAEAVGQIKNGRRHEHLRHLCGVMLTRDVAFEDAQAVLIDAWTAVGGDLAERAAHEVPNTLRTTEAAIAEGRATGVPRMEEITPGLYSALEEIFGWKIRATFSSNGSHKTHGPHGFHLTDMGNAERFIAQHGEKVRYVYEWNTWLVFNGVRWVRDVGGGRVQKLAKDTVRSMYREAADNPDESTRKAIAKHASRSEAATQIDAMLKLARCEVPITPDELDSDPYLLNCLNGTIDLRSGDLRKRRREDHITKLAPVEYDPNAEAPTWEAFLKRVQPSEEIRSFLQRGAGYGATADTSEECIFINVGFGMNGKTTCQETLRSALGDYSQRAPTEMLMVKRTGGVPNDVARLKGARFVTVSETEEGRRLAEALVKELTSQDTLSARHMRAEWFDFTPTHKLWLSTNHKPEIRGTDLAIWRRIRLIPWSVRIPPAEQNKKLLKELQAELPGVLRWIVQGALDWQTEGLNAPEAVRAATKEYRAEMDVLARFIEDRCVVHPQEEVQSSVIYKAYKPWAEETGEKIESQVWFTRRLTERGFERRKEGYVYWLGIGLGHKPPDSDPNPPNPPDSDPNPPEIETPQFAGNSLEESGGSGRSGTNPRINSSKNDFRGVMCENPPNPPNPPSREGGQLSDDLEPAQSSALPELKRRRERRQLTEEEAHQVQKLISEGMLPRLARSAVLGQEAGS